MVKLQPTSQSTRQSGLLCGLVVLCFYGQIVTAGAGNLLSRQLWMDEIHSVELIEDADVSRSLRALQDGADYNPPGYYFAARAFCRLMGGTTPERLRLFSVLCVLAGMAGLMVGLRASFSGRAAVVAVLAVSAQRLLIDQAFEIRFYALWFALIVWFAVLFDTAARRNSFQLPRGLVTAVLACGICSVHYFGILTVWIVGGVFFFSRPDFRQRAGFWLPCVASLITLGLCYPFYAGQRSALTVATWVSAPSLDHLVRFFSAIVPWFLLLAAGVAGWMSRIQRPEAYSVSWRDGVRDQRGLLSLSLLTLVLVVFSFAVQPALVPRYGFVAMAGFAPVIAWLVQGFSTRGLTIAAVVCVLLGSRQAAVLSDDLQRLDDDRVALLDMLRAESTDVPVVFVDRIDHFPLQRLGDSQATENWFLLDFQETDLPTATNLQIVQRDVARRFSKWYPDYQCLPFSRLLTYDRFLIVPYRDPDKLPLEFAGFDRRARADSRILEWTRKSSQLNQQQRPAPGHRPELAIRPQD